MLALLLPFLSGILDKIFPNAEDAAKAKLELMKMEQEGAFKQIEIDIEEAKNPRVFVSGWRPFMGWVCGSIFGYTYLIQPAILFFCALFHHSPMNLPVLNMSEIMPVLLGLLGLGSLRTVEKINGVAAK